MKNRRWGWLAASLVGLCCAGYTEHSARAQGPVVVSSYAAPAVPYVTYVPQARGLFGRRIVYRPVVGYAPVAPPVVTTYYAAPAVEPIVAGRVVTYYAPAPPIVPFVPAPAFVPAPVVPIVPAPLPFRAYYPPAVAPLFIPY